MLNLVIFYHYMSWTVPSWCNLKLQQCSINIIQTMHSVYIHIEDVHYNEERPECIPCNSNFSLKHVLIDCVDVADVYLIYLQMSQATQFCNF